MFFEVLLALRERNNLIVLVNCRAFQLLHLPRLISKSDRKLLNINALSDSFAFEMYDMFSEALALMERKIALVNYQVGSWPWKP